MSNQKVLNKRTSVKDKVATSGMSEYGEILVNYHKESPRLVIRTHKDGDAYDEMAYFVDKQYVDNLENDTAGASDTSQKIYLIGASAQTATAKTYSDDEVWTENGHLHSHILSVGPTEAYEYGSVSEGDTTLAFYVSHAEGVDSFATNVSHAEGCANQARGNNTHAEGMYSVAYGSVSHSEGKGCFVDVFNGQTANTRQTIFELSNVTKTKSGYNTIVTATYKNLPTGITVEQINNALSKVTIAYFGSTRNHSGSGSLFWYTYVVPVTTMTFDSSTQTFTFTSAEGWIPASNDLATKVNERVILCFPSQYAIGEASHVEGSNAKTGGDDVENVQVLSNYTTAGSVAHAEGHATLAQGIASHAEGQKTFAKGNKSHAEGLYTIASNEAEHAEGQYNLSISGTVHTVGIGTAENSRKNAHLITNDGKHYIPGVGGYIGTESGLTEVQDLATVMNNLVPMEEITYNDLVTLRNSSGLTPGKQYRITDYQCTTSQENTRAATNQFDILVTALDNKTLSESAKAVWPKNDKYLIIGDDNNEDDPGVFMIDDGSYQPVYDGTIEIDGTTYYKWLCEDAGSSFHWIITEEETYVEHYEDGELVGYPFAGLLDENGDETTYGNGKWSNGTKQIVKTDRIGYFNNSNLSAWELKYCLDNDTNRFTWADTTKGKGVIYYMKDEWNNECPYDFKNIQFKRWEVTAYTKVPSLVVDNEDNNYGYYYGAKNLSGSNVLQNATYGSNSGWFYTFALKDLASDNWYDYTVVNSLGLKNDEGNEVVCYGNVLNEAKDEYYSGKGQLPILLNNIVFFNCYSDLSEPSYADDYTYCYSNTFGNDCQYNAFGNYCYVNTFGNDCQYNAFGNDCQSNTFGNNCYSNMFGNSCYGNTFGNNCYSNMFGNSCYGNTFGNGSSTRDYYKYIIIENGNRFIYLDCPNSTSSNYYQNVKICQGVNNTNTYKTITDGNVGQTYQTEYKPANSQVISV